MVWVHQILMEDQDSLLWICCLENQEKFKDQQELAILQELDSHSTNIILVQTFQILNQCGILLILNLEQDLWHIFFKITKIIMLNV